MFGRFESNVLTLALVELVSKSRARSLVDDGAAVVRTVDPEATFAGDVGCAVGDVATFESAVTAAACFFFLRFFFPIATMVRTRQGS